MKRLTFCLALPALLIAGTVGAYRIIEVPEVGARTVTMVMGGVAAEGCTTPAGGVLRESFGDDSTACYSGASGGDASCINTWTVVGDSATFKHELQSGAPTGSCTYGLLHDTANESEERISYDLGAGGSISYETTTDVEFSIYFNSLSIDASATITLMLFGNSNSYSSPCSGLQVTKISDVYYLRATAGTGADNVQIATGTWYTVKVRMAGTAAESYFQITGDGISSCTDTSCTFTRQDYNKRYFNIGSIFGEGAGEAASFEIGYFVVSNP